MIQGKSNVGAAAAVLLAAVAIAAAAAPAQAVKGLARRPTGAAEPESNEQIVADFLLRKGRAEKAQRAIVADLRKALDRKRLELEDARKTFEDARARYAEVVGPLADQGVTAPDDPRLPYDYDVRKSSPGFTR